MNVARILIVEDDFETADFLNLLLSQNGYCVINVVGTGEEAIDTALRTSPDLMLVDIKLRSHLDGIAACEQIKKSIDIPFIFVSAHTEKDVIARALRSGPSGYIVKPFTCKHLMTQIENALRKKILPFENEVEHAFDNQFSRPDQV